MCAQVCEHSQNIIEYLNILWNIVEYHGVWMDGAPKDFWGSHPSLWKRSHLAWETQKISWKIMKNSWAGGSEPEIWRHFIGKRPQEISKTVRCLGNTRQRAEDFEVCLSQGCQGCRESKWGKIVFIDLYWSELCNLLQSHAEAVPQLRCYFPSTQSGKRTFFTNLVVENLWKLLCISENDFIRQRLCQCAKQPLWFAMTMTL